MGQSHACVIVHLVFGTKKRHAFINDLVKSDLHAYIAGIARSEGADVYEIGGVEDHVHVLLSLPRTIAISVLAERIKSGSSKWIKTKQDDLKFFAWQQGYGIFSVSQSNLKAVRSYIQNQEEHHRKFKFQDELRLLLQKHNIQFDKRDIA